MKTQDPDPAPEFRGAKVHTEEASTPGASRPESPPVSSATPGSAHPPHPAHTVARSGERELKKNRCLRATDREWAEVAERARQAGYTRSTFLLTAALSGRPRPRPDQPTRDALYHLARLGNNLNQIAHAANTPNRIVDEDRLHRVLDEIVHWLEAHS